MNATTPRAFSSKYIHVYKAESQKGTDPGMHGCAIPGLLKSHVSGVHSRDSIAPLSAPLEFLIPVWARIPHIVRAVSAGHTMGPACATRSRRSRRAAPDLDTKPE